MRFNAEGVALQSPGLVASTYPGLEWPSMVHYPERVAQVWFIVEPFQGSSILIETITQGGAAKRR
jgi:hypothetical protein